MNYFHQGFLASCLVFVSGGLSCSSPSSTAAAANTGGTAGTAAQVGGNSNSAGATSGGQSTTNTGEEIAATACTGTFNACGGDVAGTWIFEHICAEGDIKAYVNDQLSQSYSTACNTACQSASLTGSGRLDYSGSSVFPNVRFTTTMDLLLTADCLTAALGQNETITTTSCNAFATLRSRQSGTTATCTVEVSNCHCAMTVVQSDSYSDSFSLSGTTIVGGTGSVTAYCVQGNTLLERQAIGDNAYVDVTMTKQ